MIGGILRPKSTYLSTLAPPASPDPLFPRYTCLLLFLLFLTTAERYVSTLVIVDVDTAGSTLARLRCCIPVTTSTPQSTTTYHPAIQSRSLQNQQRMHSNIACWTSRHALQTPYGFLDPALTITIAKRRPHGRPSSNRPGEWPATDFSSSAPPNRLHQSPSWDVCPPSATPYCR
ncbi:hypothetical protein CSAL01_12860 [Colletotrichum salicis]|uniref:Uncharacterized protein n=1 Tax=Colletotrichum salicis TaxID=1209931 RepID=A0A135TMK2_9PEZI|nr:hypothetical protein CSAL01_12860 [Colletotrichum salicis]